MSGRVSLVDNNGPLVNIAAWFTLVVAILAMGGKIYTKATLVKTLDWTDAAIVSATLSSVAMIVATADQVNNGLGRIRQTIPDPQVNRFYLATYVASVFYVLAVFISKFACLHFCQSLTRGGHILWFIRGGIVFTGLWIVISVLVQSFQCSLPNTWLLTKQDGTCIHETAFWTIHGISDILTQLLMGCLPLYILQDIHTDNKRKRFLMLSFFPNLLTIPCVVVRIVYLRTLYSSDNPIQDSWKLFMISVIHANVAIIAACIPFSKPILDSMAVGVITNDVRHGLVWDQINYLGISRGRKSMSSNRTPIGSKIKRSLNLPKSFGSSLMRPTVNDTIVRTLYEDLEEANEDQTKIRRTIETTVEAVEMTPRSTEQQNS